MTERKTPKERVSTPPKHLSAASKGFWTRVHAEFVLEEHHDRLLQAALEAWDRMTQAREIVAKKGPIVVDRFGQLRAHPGVGIERDARAAFRQLIRELNLDGVGDPSLRPPRIRGRYHGS